MSILVEPALEPFLEKAILTLSPMETVTHCCRRCGEPVLFPIVVRQGDVEAFRTLLDIAREFLAENGVQEMILERLWERIAQRRNLQ